MKSKILTLLLISIFICDFQTAHAQIIHKYLYVSPTGNDDNSGTLNEPLASFEGAQKLVRAFKVKNKNIPTSIYFRGGKYYRTQSTVFDAADGGSKSGPIKYMAYPGEVPLILGGKQLKLDWQLFKDGIYKAKVPEGIIFESLFIDDQEQVLARYPNYDPDIRIFNGTSADCISSEKVKKWKDPVDGYFHVIHKAMWGGFHYKITGKESKGKLIMEGGWQNNRPENGLHKELRYVENIFEELDVEKEWYLDRKKSILYFKPEKGIELKNANVEVAYLENFIKVIGTEDKPVQYLSFDGFHFNRTIRTFMKCKDKLMRSDWTIYRSGAIFFEGTEHCVIENCEFSQIGGNAVFMNSYNRNSSVTGCHIHDIGANAICFVGDTSAVRNPKFVPYGPPVSNQELDLIPDPKNNQYPAYCVADNNLIHDFGKVEKQVAGVEISIAAYITVSHNSIYDCPRAGINISEGAFGGHLIEFNDVFNTVLETADHGSFNSWGRDRFWMIANKKTEKRVENNRSVILLDILAPTIIRNNRMRCDHGWDIDLDDGSSYYHLYNNLCLTNGIKLREGYYRKVENNICINNALHPHAWLKNNSDIIRGNIFGSQLRPYSVDYWGTEFDYNWYLSKVDLENAQKSGIDSNSKFGDPEFINVEKGDFRVKPESKLFDLGWKNFPMDNFGVQKEALKRIAKQPELPIVEKIKKEESEIVPFYGGQIKNIETDGEVSATGMHDKTGVLIVKVPDKNAIAAFGLKKGDVILKVNNEVVVNVNYILEKSKILESKGKLKTIEVWRNQNSIILKRNK